MQLRKNPLGDYVGKIGNTVGGKWRSIYWVRTLVFPTQRGTLPLWRMLKAGALPPERFSYKQMNLRRLSLQILGFIAKENMQTFTSVIWNPLAKNKRDPMSGANLFVKKNAARLFHSMPHTDQEFDPDTNSPDLTTITMSDGTLENTPILTATYDAASGELAITWNKTCYTNGNQDDYVYIAALKKPLLNSYEYPDGEWEPAIHLYGPEWVGGEPPAVPKERKDESASITLPTGLDADDLTAFLFFRTQAGLNSGTISQRTISDSTAIQVVAVP